MVDNEIVNTNFFAWSFNTRKILHQIRICFKKYKLQVHQELEFHLVKTYVLKKYQLHVVHLINVLELYVYLILLLLQRH